MTQAFTKQSAQGEVGEEGLISWVKDCDISHPLALFFLVLISQINDKKFFLIWRKNLKLEKSENQGVTLKKIPWQFSLYNTKLYSYTLKKWQERVKKSYICRPSAPCWDPSPTGNREITIALFQYIGKRIFGGFFHTLLRWIFCPLALNVQNFRLLNTFRCFLKETFSGDLDRQVIIATQKLSIKIHCLANNSGEKCTLRHCIAQKIFQFSFKICSDSLNRPPKVWIYAVQLNFTFAKLLTH